MFAEILSKSGNKSSQLFYFCAMGRRNKNKVFDAFDAKVTGEPDG